MTEVTWGVLEFVREFFRIMLGRHPHPHRHRARWLHFNFRFGTINVTGAFMTVTMLPTDTKRTTVSPVKADGTPSTAKLSNQSYVSSDPALAVAADPADTTGNTIVLTGQGTSTTVIVTATALATEPDGTTTETITGALTVVLAVPPPAPAAALVFSPLV